MSLESASVPPLGPEDHVRGDGPAAILYLDLACPHCAATWQGVRELPLRFCVRHFPIAAKHPRAPVLHAAVEAAGLQRPEAFWALWDATYADQGRQDDPHLWERARDLELDLERFERDRRADQVSTRIRADFEGGIRAGVMVTPTAFLDGRMVARGVGAALVAAAGESV